MEYSLDTINSLIYAGFCSPKYFVLASPFYGQHQPLVGLNLGLCAFLLCVGKVLLSDIFPCPSAYPSRCNEGAPGLHELSSEKLRTGGQARDLNG